MSNQLRLRRGSTAAHAVFTGALAELTVDTDKESIVLHDGVTPGGFPGGGFLQGLTGATVRSVESKMRERVSVEDFFIAAEADSTGMFERAILSGAAEIELQGKEYFTSRVLYLDGGIKLTGKGSSDTKITKTTNTTGTGSNLARSGTVVDSYNKNAVFILRHADNDFNYNTQFEGIQIKSNGYTVEYGVYAPRTTHMKWEDVYIFQCRYGYVTHDSWLTSFIKVIANCNSVDPQGVPNVAPSSYGWTGAVGFWWQNDGSGSATGTSFTAIQCWARDCHDGWKFYGLQYSALHGCAADNISNIPYDIFLSKLSLNGCGTENTQIGPSGASYKIDSSYVTMNMCQAQTQSGASSGTNAMLYVNNSRVVLNSCQLENFDTPGVSFNTIIQANSRVINNGSNLPTNGNSFISFSGGSQLIDNNTVPPTIRSEAAGTLTRYNMGRLRDNEVLEKANKAVVSAGTVIATFTCNGGAAAEAVAVRLRIVWFDTTFATGVGVSNVEVVCYQDASGTNYRQAINTSVNIGAGNGYTTAPTYTLTRSGNVWSLTMTPAHGDVTCRTITAEVENVTGFTVALP